MGTVSFYDFQLEPVKIKVKFETDEFKKLKIVLLFELIDTFFYLWFFNEHSLFFVVSAQTLNFKIKIQIIMFYEKTLKEGDYFKKTSNKVTKLSRS